MLKAFIQRLKQKERTMKFPAQPPVLPERFRGLPIISPAGFDENAARQCPVGAMSAAPRPQIDMGRCIFCGRCAEFTNGAVTFSREYSLAASTREALIFTGEAFKKAEALDKQARLIFGHSLKLRQVSAGGCAACEADVNVLGTLAFDLGRFGIQFVASPRHADGVLITGPVTKNMEYALSETYAAIPEPKIAIAVGACAISGGIYAGSAECTGIPGDIPVSLYVPGCPPHPITILDGLLRLLGRIA